MIGLTAFQRMDLCSLYFIFPCIVVGRLDFVAAEFAVWQQRGPRLVSLRTCVGSIWGVSSITSILLQSPFMVYTLAFW